jgi:hypothetical protein
VRPVSARYARLAKAEKQLSSRIELENLMQADIREPNIILSVNGEAVREQERVRAPRSEVSAAGSVKYFYGGLIQDCERGILRSCRSRPEAARAMENEDIPMRVHVDPGCLSQRMSLGEPRPSMHNLVAGLKRPSMSCSSSRDGNPNDAD